MNTVFSRPLPRAIAMGAFALSAFAAATVPATAAPRAGLYSVTLAAPLAAPKQEIINGNVWKCAESRCSARADGARALFVCQTLVRKIGPVASFSAPQGPLSEEDVRRCNGG